MLLRVWRAISVSALLHLVRFSEPKSIVTQTITPSTCTKPSTTVYIYTSGSSTYVVSDIGSATPPFQTTSGSAAGSPDESPLYIPSHRDSSTASTATPPREPSSRVSASSYRSIQSTADTQEEPSWDLPGPSSPATVGLEECPTPRTVTVTAATKEGVPSNAKESSPERTVTTFIFVSQAEMKHPFLGIFVRSQKRQFLSWTGQIYADERKIMSLRTVGNTR